ncbi:serine/threonine-protein kinase [Rubricoccus marinus]|uniref:non-specific serine/threonine protein kinase n=1 Tax=Rubricoccus marinus TaxID=716817 RepID=A0A259U0Y6_9BACT|nr:serine/threonine-protein kinase [Rubricoccus marinus]OZC03659.1 hypothetical protein BSZ36_12120 [Rubricoccus marinus]
MTASPPASGASPDDGSFLVGRSVGPYRIEERIGGGGMGVVYRATDTRLGRTVALKFLAARLRADPTARQRLREEARAVAALDHPHVASVFDVGETEDGREYVAMAFYEGETLEARLQQGPLAPEAAVEIACQIASGLGAAHRAGIVHRDVKPANVMLVGEPASAKVLDFGIAKTEHVHLTQEGESVGTALYMSPEQLRGEPTDARSDVWALGAVLYEMLAGRRPFGGSYAAAIGYAVLHEDPPPLAGDLPDGLEAVVLRCLAKSPEARYASMEALAADLDAFQDGRVPPAPEATPARAGTGLWRWAAALLAVVLVAIAVVVLWPEPARAESQRLVVLPFRASGPDAEALSEGLVEAVTSKLGALGPLRERVRVVPASEVEAGMTPSEAHERFGATLVVEGSVATEGDEVRVTFGLVEVGREGPVQGPTEQIDDARGSSFALQDAAALGVLRMLRIEIGAAEKSALASGGTGDPEANERYLRGRGVLRNQQSDADVARARDLFGEAISRDPAFALAYAGLAEAEWQTYRRTDAVEWADRAIANAKHALELDDGLAEVHISLAIIYQGRQRFRDGLASIDRALEIDPTNGEAVRRQAKIYADLGRAPEAERAFRRAIALAPDLWRPYNSLGVFYLDEGRAAEAAAQFQKGLEINPVNLSLFINLGVASVISGDFEQAQRAFEEVLRLDPDDSDAAYNLSTVRAFLGDTGGAVEAAQRAVALRPDDYEAHEALAEALWNAGKQGEARASFQTSLRLARGHLTVGRDPDVLKVMARVFALSGQRDSARVYLREIGERISPEAASVQEVFVIGVTHELAGQRAEALSWLRSALDRGFGAEQIKRSPWLGDLREDPLAISLLTPDP